MRVLCAVGLSVYVDVFWWEAAVGEANGGVGSVLFVGAGAAVLEDAILIEFYGPLVQRSVEFWIGVRLCSTHETTDCTHCC